MNKFLVIVAVFFVVLPGSRFTAGQSPQTPPVCRKPGDVNPNGSSELSILMRRMYDHAVAARKDVMIKKTARSFPQDFLKIYTATPTDSLTKNSSYNPFADGYIYSLNNFRASAKGDLVDNYNNLVTACLNCHSQHCPGPVPKMKKLLIREAGK